MKKYLTIINIIILLFLNSSIVYAHPGRLDSNGGHYNRKTGEYHYHNGTHTSSSNNKNITSNDESNSTNSITSYSFNELYNGKITTVKTNTSYKNTSNTNLNSTKEYSFIRDHWFILLIVIYFFICILSEFIELIKNFTKRLNVKNGEKCFCTNCGKKIKPDWAFCNHCGNKLK